MSVYVDLKAEFIIKEDDFRRSLERGLSEEEKRVKNKQNVEEFNQINLEE